MYFESVEITSFLVRQEKTSGLDLGKVKLPLEYMKISLIIWDKLIFFLKETDIIDVVGETCNSTCTFYLV